MHILDMLYLCLPVTAMQMLLVPLVKSKNNEFENKDDGVVQSKEVMTSY